MKIPGLSSPINRAGFVIFVAGAIFLAASWLWGNSSDYQAHFLMKIWNPPDFSPGWFGYYGWAHWGRLGLLLCVVGAWLAWLYHQTLGRLIEWIKG